MQLACQADISVKLMSDASKYQNDTQYYEEDNSYKA